YAIAPPSLLTTAWPRPPPRVSFRAAGPGWQKSFANGDYEWPVATMTPPRPIATTEILLWYCPAPYCGRLTLVVRALNPHRPRHALPNENAECLPTRSRPRPRSLARHKGWS